MPIHRSLGVETLVALMAAHRVSVRDRRSALERIGQDATERSRHAPHRKQVPELATPTRAGMPASPTRA